MKFPAVNPPPPSSGVVCCHWCGEAVDVARGFEQVVCLRGRDGTMHAQRPTGKYACPACADRLDAGDNPLAVG